MSKPYLLWGTAVSLNTAPLPQLSVLTITFHQATFAMVFIIPLAVDSIRKRSYEFFLIFHIGFSIVAVIGCF